MTVCGYKYYDQAYIDSQPALKKTDTFVRFLLCNQKAIQQLTDAFYNAGQIQRAQGKSYCYRYFNIYKYLPNLCKNCKKCDYCKSAQDSRVYQATTIYIFWTTSQKMATDPEFTKKLLDDRKLLYFNTYTRTYEEMELDNLDIQVLLLFSMGAQIQSLYRACNNCFWYLEQGRDFCYNVVFPYDLAGCPLATINYSGRALRELTFTYSDTFAGSTSPQGKKCLLNKCGDAAEK